MSTNDPRDAEDAFEEAQIDHEAERAYWNGVPDVHGEGRLFNLDAASDVAKESFGAWIDNSLDALGVDAVTEDLEPSEGGES